MKKLLEYEDLRKMEYLSAPSVSPDGRQAAYVVQKADQTGRFVPRIFLIDTEWGEISPLFEDSAQEADAPAFSPDGQKLAYLRKGKTENQIWVYDRESRKHKKVTSARHGVEEFTWSADSRKLAFTAPCFPAERLNWLREMTEREKRQWTDERDHSPVVIENLLYKLDDTYGVRDGSVRQIGIVCAGGSGQQILTDGRMDCYKPAFSRDGRFLAYYGRPYAHVKELTPEIFVRDLKSGEVSMIKGEREADDTDPVIFAADGQSVIFAAYEKGKNGGFSLQLFRRSRKDGREICLFPEEEICHGVDSLPLGRTAYGRESAAYQINADGQYIYFRSGWMGCENLYRLSLAGEAVVESVLEDKMSVHSFCVPMGGKIVYTRGNLLTPAELYAVPYEEAGVRADREAQRRLTVSNSWLEEFELSLPEELWVDSYDKKARIHGFVMKPSAYEEGMKYPAVLDVHGGPSGFYAHDFWFEFQMIAARGMAVVYCDPRGSFGYGMEFASGSYCWGQESMDDLFAFMDGAAELGFIDAEWTGVTGGSYGGHMTNRIIGTTDRFKAAVTQRTLANLATSYGTGDMGFIWSENGMQSELENLLSRAEKSPIGKIDRMKTPLLILHGEKDYRCSLEQGEQMFIAMKDRNPEVPVRFVVFPGENHGITRHGKVHFQIAHLRELTEWFVRFLVEKEDWKGEKA